MRVGMNEDPISQALTALHGAIALLPCVGGDAQASLAGALDRVATALERLNGLEARLAAQQALLDDRLVRVENSRLFGAWNAVVSYARRLLGRQNASPASAGALAEDYSVWVAHEQAGLPEIEEARAVASRWPRQPLFSLVTEGGNPEPSVHNQSYGHWELCADPARAGGEYLCFLHRAGTLSPFALHYLAEALQSGDYDLLYSDEDEIDAGGGRAKPKFKPDWSPALLSSCMYLGSLVAVSRRRFAELGGFRTGLDGAHLHDLALRLTDRGARVHHIGRVLFHASDGNAPAAISRRGNPSARTEMAAIVCSKSPGLLDTCLKSLRATAAETVRHVIVICHEETGPNEELRRVIQRHGAQPVTFTGAFNYSVMNNLGAAQARTPCLLFLNDDVRATAYGWTELLAEQLSGERVGIAGAVLRYPSGALQHAGMVTGMNDGVGHVGRHMRSSELWPWLLTTRNVSAVTGACLAIRADLFRALGGFDPAFPNNYNDVDLCFRAREAGREIVCVPVPGLVHAECQTRPFLVRFEERYEFFRRWGLQLSRPDPYFSTSLSPSETITLNVSGETGYNSVLAKYRG